MPHFVILVPDIKEEFLKAYNENEQANINDPIGEVLLWSLSLKTRPEFNCFC